MRIVIIVGIWTFHNLYGPIFKHYKAAFANEFPHAQLSVEYLWYSPWQGQKMRNFADHILRKYDTGEEILLVGYSIGGSIACAIAPRFKHSAVRAVVTVFAPHTFLWGIFSRMLNVDLRRIPVAPVFSFEGRLDWAVLWGAKHPRARKHAKLWCDHLFGLLFSQKPAEKIAKITRETLTT